MAVHLPDPTPTRRAWRFLLAEGKISKSSQVVRALGTTQSSAARLWLGHPPCRVALDALDGMAQEHLESTPSR
jgi:hypothetical protein